jgi:putative ABC transport system permease protein
VRKVLGATVTQIALLLSKEFTWLVVAANIVAFPPVYWATRSWLSEFAYPVSLGPGVFALGGIMALLVAWPTVGGQALRAARQNPVDALRCE